MDESLNLTNIILEEFTDFERNWAMVNRNFDSADFGAIAALTVEQLLTAVKEYPTEIILGSLCEKLDRLRAEQVKALAIQNMYRSEEWRNRLWYIGPNGQQPPQDQQTSSAYLRNRQLKFCQDGIGLSATWENRVKSITARVEALYQDWADLCDQVKIWGQDNTEHCHKTAKRIIEEQKWLRDQSGMASVSMSVLANHRGVKDLNFVSDGAGDESSKAMATKFTWISFR